MPGCPSDDALAEFVDGRLEGARLAELEAHVASCDDCRRVTAATLVAALDDTGDDAEPGAADDAPEHRGTVLGRYVLLDAIGAGAMGVVYRAYDSELDRRVAIKLLRRADADDAQRQRMLREAQAMAKVSSPFVVAVYDAGAVDGRAFVAMELVEGETLAAWLRREPRAWPAIVARFVECGRGLEAAHDAGLVHRDFKPDNVLVTADVAKVTDFGLARPLRAAAESVRTRRPSDASEAPRGAHLARTLTRTGALMGTPAYMAPEQLLGERADAKSDQFAFSVALYEALVGKRPFAGATFDELRSAVLSGKIDEALRLRSAPAALRAAILRGLSVDPERRFPSMRELVRGIDVRASAPRRRWVAVGVAALGAAALGATAVAMAPRVPSCAAAAEGRAADAWNEPLRARAKAAFFASGRPFAGDVWRTVDASIGAYLDGWKRQRVEICEATRVRGEQSEELFDLRMRCLDGKLTEAVALARTFGSADAVVVDSAVQASAGLSPLAACADAHGLRARVRPPSDPAARAKLAELGEGLAAARATGETGRYADAHTQLDRLMEPVRAVAYPPLLAQALLLDGEQLDRAADYKGAAERLRDAAWTGIAARDEDTALAAMARLVEITGYRLAQKSESTLWDRAADAHLDARGRPATAEALLEQSRGSLARAEGHYEDARTHLERALEIERRAVGNDHPQIAVILTDLGYTLRQLGEYEAARAALTEAIALRERAFGKAHPLVASTESQLGAVYYSWDRLDDAQAVLEEAERVQEASLGPMHLETGYTINRLGNVHSSRGECEQALGCYSRALAIGEKALGADHPEVGLAHMNLGIQLRECGRSDDADRELVAARRVLEAKLGPDYPFLASVLSELGSVRKAQHRDAEAARLHADGLALLDRTLGSGNPDSLELVVRVAEDEIDEGKPEAAIKRLTPALDPANPATKKYKSSDSVAARFALARALWAGGADHARARDLAESARADCRYDTPRDRRRRADIDAWLAAHAVSGTRR